MKQFIFTTLITLSFLSNYGFAGTTEKVEPTDVVITVTFGGEIGVKNRQCRGISFECVDIGFDIDIVKTQLSSPAKPGKESIQFEVLSKEKIKLSFFNSESGDMEITTDFFLNEKIAVALGYKNGVLLKGKYRTVKNSKGLTEVIVNARLN